MKKCDDPSFFLGHYGESRVWLLFSETSNNEENNMDSVSSDILDFEDECGAYEASQLTSKLPPVIEEVLLECFSCGLYRVKFLHLFILIAYSKAQREGSSVSSAYIYRDDSGKLCTNLKDIDRICFYESEWLHTVRKIDEYFSEAFHQLNEGNFSLRSNLAIMCKEQNHGLADVT